MIIKLKNYNLFEIYRNKKKNNKMTNNLKLG